MSEPSIKGHGRQYVLAIIALLVLTGLSYGASRLSLGNARVAVALAIATAKASIVAVVFMHLRTSSNTTRLVLCFTAAFIVLLSLGMIADVAAR